MAAQRPTPEPPEPLRRSRLPVLLIVLLAAGAVLAYRIRDTGIKMQDTARRRSNSEFKILNSEFSLVGSPSCKDCHAKAYELWQNSNHARAERLVDPAQDQAAFDPLAPLAAASAPREIKHGTQVSKAQCNAGRFEIVTAGPDGQVKPFAAERVIGVHPLHQFLVAWPGGRYQVTELAVASGKNEWFDVFGTEDRKAGEWGHWTGRGMTWNSMCAACHNTRVRKNYNRSSDTYDTTMAERGVGCEACHGPLAQHVTWQTAHAKDQPRPKDPYLPRFSGDDYYSTCGACHARRSDLTGNFTPGDQFLDHFSPAIPDETETYYADGQVHEEDFEYVSFLGSRMYGLGVRCAHCHNVHSGKTVLTGNQLCLQCHGGKIAPDAHGHHKPATPGALCVDCHMPQTPYMQRHLRRDHGLTIPDPLLTKEHAIPNACSRCHKDKTLDWNIDAARQWYGKRLERYTQDRARWIARARAGADDAPALLLKLARNDPNPFWKAVGAGLLGGYVGLPEARGVLVECTQSPSPLLRAVAARALNNCGTVPPVRAALQKLLQDPSRLVRVEAAWALRADVPFSCCAGVDLQNFLKQNEDQPGGLLQLAVFTLDRGAWFKLSDKSLDSLRAGGVPEPVLSKLDPLKNKEFESEERLLSELAKLLDRDELQRFQDLVLNHADHGGLAAALPLFRQAIAWDEHSPQLRQAYATALSMAGESAEAVRQLEKACLTEPRNASVRYDWGLALGETGNLEGARKAFREAVALEPRFARAWYNLGLAASKLGDTAEAVKSLQQAEKLDPNSADYPYALATVHLNAGKLDDARAAAARALRCDKTHAGAAELLKQLEEKK